MPKRSFTYEFDELPLVTFAGLEAGHVSGFAEIGYDHTGAWSIGRIGFDGVKRLKPTLEDHVEAKRLGRPVKFFERKKVFLDEGDPLQLIIYHRLEHDWRAQVQARVDDRVFDDRNDDGAEGDDHILALQKEQV